MTNDEKLAKAINMLIQAHPNAVIRKVDLVFDVIRFTENGKAMFVSIDWGDGTFDGPWPDEPIDDDWDRPVVGPGSDVWP